MVGLKGEERIKPISDSGVKHAFADCWEILQYQYAVYR